MGTLSAGQVILVPFPFSELSQTKVRPVVCLASAGHDDWILCQITSNSYGDPLAIPISASDLTVGSLISQSFVRPGKLFTAHKSLSIRSVATLSASALDHIVEAVIGILKQ